MTETMTNAGMIYNQYEISLDVNRLFIAEYLLELKLEFCHAMLRKMYDYAKYEYKERGT